MYGGYHHPYGGFPGGGYQQLGNFGYGGGYPYSYAGNAMLTVAPPEAFPIQQYDPSPYNTNVSNPFMPWSRTSTIAGFRIMGAVGEVWGSYDSPPRTDDQPYTAGMAAACKKAALADLQSEAAKVGANGLVDVKFEINQNTLGNMIAVRSVLSTLRAYQRSGADSFSRQL